MPSIQYYNSIVGEQVKVIGQNVGIGTSTPSAKLNVENGNVIFNDLGGNFDFRVEGDADTNLLFVDASNDSINIGTGSSTGSKLYVSTNNVTNYSSILASGDAGSQSSLIRVSNINNSINDSFAGLYISVRKPSTSTDQGVFISCLSSTEHVHTPHIVFVSRSGSSTFQELMRISSSGNVGIGTNSPTEKLDVNGSIKTRTGGVGHEDQGCYVAYPGGGTFSTGTATNTGYLKITLPVSWTATMLAFDIDIYEYTTRKIKKFRVGGYNFTGNNWVNVSALMDSDNDFAKYKVHFGHDGTKCAVYISEIDSNNADLGSSTTWNYCKVSLSNLFAGHSNNTMANWADGWSISFTTTLGTITGGTIEVSRPYRQHDTSYVFNEYGGNVDFRVEGDTDQYLLFTDASTDRVGISTSVPDVRLQLNESVVDDNGYVYDTNACMIVHPTPTSDTSLNDPKEILYLARQGTAGQAYGAAAAFSLSRYENSSNNSRTRLDIDLAHGTFLNSKTKVITMLSDGNVGIGTIQPSQKLDVNGRVKANLFVTQDPRSATNLPVGWYTIAVNVGNRAIGRFGLTCESGGRHQGIIFYASHYYGLGNQISILHNNRYSGSNPIAKLRIKEGGTYDGCLLQVYIDDATNTPTVYLLNDNISTTGWNLVALTADGTNPGGVSNFANLNNVAVEVDLDITDFGTTGQSIFQGNVGIGTSSPTRQLHTDGTTALIADGSTYELDISASAATLGGNRFQLLGTETVFNEAGGNFDFRVEGDSDADLLFTDASTDRVGIGLGSTTFSLPTEKLDIKGSFGIHQTYKIASSEVYTSGAGSVNGVSITLNQEHGTVLNTNFYYLVRLHTNLVGSGLSASLPTIDSGSSYLVWYNRSTSSWVARAIGLSGTTAEHPLLGINGSNAIAYTNSPSGCRIYINVEAYFKTLNRAVPHYMGSDYHWQRSVDNLYYTDGNVGIGTPTPAYKLDVNGTFSANSININNQYTFPTADGSSGQALVTNGAGVVSWSDIASANLTRGSFEVTSTQSTFTVSGGYTLNTLSVYYNGIKLLLGTDFTATNGTTFTLTNAAVNGDIVEYWALNSASSAVGNTSTGSVSVTSNQTVFNVTNGYTVGGLVVFVNGVKLVDGVDFTATNGSSFTLTSAATSGDVVDYVAYGAVVASSNLQKTGDTMTGNLTIGNGSDLIVEGDLIVAKYKEGFVNIGNTGSAQTIDISSGTLQTCILNSSCTFTMPTAEAGRSFTLLLKTGTGSFTSTFTNVKWPNDTAPTITTTASKMDILTFVSDGVNWYGNISQNYTV